MRWFQWGAFCPLFRSHGRRLGGPVYHDNTQCGRTGASNEIWNFGEEAEQAISRVMQVRVRDGYGVVVANALSG